MHLRATLRYHNHPHIKKFMYNSKTFIRLISGNELMIVTEKYLFFIIHNNKSSTYSVCNICMDSISCLRNPVNKHQVIRLNMVVRNFKRKNKEKNYNQDLVELSWANIKSLKNVTFNCIRKIVCRKKI